MTIKEWWRDKEHPGWYLLKGLVAGTLLAIYLLLDKDHSVDFKDVMAMIGTGIFGHMFRKES